jgi:arsenate reductase
MTVTIYHNPRCSKSRQTLELLRANNIEPDIIEYLDTPPDHRTLISLLDKLGIGARQLMRNKEQAYKDADLDNPDLSESELINAMVEQPKLIERPIVVIGDKAVLGRPPENVLKILE